MSWRGRVSALLRSRRHDSLFSTRGSVSSGSPQQVYLQSNSAITIGATGVIGVFLAWATSRFRGSSKSELKGEPQPTLSSTNATSLSDSSEKLSPEAEALLEEYKYLYMAERFKPFSRDASKRIPSKVFQVAPDVPPLPIITEPMIDDVVLDPTKDVFLHVRLCCYILSWSYCTLYAYQSVSPPLLRRVS